MVYAQIIVSKNILGKVPHNTFFMRVGFLICRYYTGTALPMLMMKLIPTFLPFSNQYLYKQISKYAISQTVSVSNRITKGLGLWEYGPRWARSEGLFTSISGSTYWKVDVWCGNRLWWVGIRVTEACRQLTRACVTSITPHVCWLLKWLAD